NGIASERLTERELGINHGDFTRREFQDKCRDVCKDYEAEFTDDVNGIASERLTERELGINHGDFTRREFQDKCRDVC
ncbi:hypothetical protein B9D92_21875, partial [Mycobacterium tuberculosis]